MEKLAVAVRGETGSSRLYEPSCRTVMLVAGVLPVAEVHLGLVCLRLHLDVLMM